MQIKGKFLGRIHTLYLQNIFKEMMNVSHPIIGIVEIDKIEK
jgi:hypothetical protein